MYKVKSNFLVYFYFNERFYDFGTILRETRNDDQLKIKIFVNKDYTYRMTEMQKHK